MSLPCGTCVSSQVINGVTLEDRTYDIAESTFLRAVAVEGAKFLNDGHATLLEDVKQPRRLYRDELVVEFQSAATGGKSQDDCGPFDPQDARNDVEESWIAPQHMYIELALCYKKLIRTWHGRKLKRGAAESELDTSFNDWVVDAILRGANRQLDKLIWMGDYRSANKSLAHFDGLVKKIYNRISSAGFHTQTFTFAGVVSGDSIEGRVGGQEFEIPFNTSNTQTAADFETYLAALQVNGTAIFTVTRSGAVVTVANQTAGEDNGIEVYITDGSGVDYLCNAATVAGDGTVAVVDTVPVAGCTSPLTIPMTALTKNNIIDEICLLYVEISSRRPELQDIPGMKLHVSEHAYALLNAALAVAGVGNFQDAFAGFGERKSRPFGFDIVPSKHLPKDLMVYADSNNLFFGTDLMSDMSTVSQWIDKDCQEVKFRMEMTAGVGIGNGCEIATNMGGWNPAFNAAVEPNYATNP